MAKIKIGMVQMTIETSKFGKKKKIKNLNRAEELVCKLLSKENDIDIVVLPEEFYAGSSYNFTNIPCNINQLEDKVLKGLRDLAKTNKCYIVGSVITNRNEDDTNDRRYENLGFVIDRNGDIIGYQGKFHGFKEEIEYIKPESQYNIFNLDVGKIGIVLGVDIFYPEIVKRLKEEGAEIILVPALITKLNERESEIENNIFVKLAKQSVLTAAMQNKVFVVFVNALGNSIHVDSKFFGGSVVATPLGNSIFIGNEETIKIVEIDTTEIEIASELISIL